MKKIKKAVIPVAGLGTRFLPITKSVPKPLLPVIDKPIIEYAVREASNLGINEIALVISPNMNEVVNYFNFNHQYINQLKKINNTEQIKKLETISNLAKVTEIIQENPIGPGDAILQAKEFCNNEPFLVIFPDDLVFDQLSASAQILNEYNKYGNSVIGLIKIHESQIPFKGIVDISSYDKNTNQINYVVEKPTIKNAPSDISILGRYIFTSDIFNYLEKCKNSVNGELQITDAIQMLIKNSLVLGKIISGYHADCGSPEGMLRAIIKAAKSDPVLSKVIDELI
ncbi:MAG: UTP--glucose-1-phosphate uridylyltransferase [Dehalococcoidia bacterium]